MIERQLGTSGLVVSKLGLNCMGLWSGGAPAPSASLRRESMAAIRAAHDLGITFFDTAAAYGPHTNEEMVGEAIAPFRHEVLVATKFGYRVEHGRVVALDSRPESIRQSVEGSLKRLGIERIDLLYQQRVDPCVPIEDVAGAVRDLMAQGKVMHFGLCEVDDATLRRAHAVQRVSVVQADYSLWNRNAEEGLLETLGELGIGLVPWNPLGQGYAVGMNTSTRTSMQFNRSLLSRIRAVADRCGATVQQVASAWLMTKRPWIVPMIDSSQLTALIDGLAAGRLKLLGEDLMELDAGMRDDGLAAPPRRLVDRSDHGDFHERHHSSHR